MSAYNQLLLIFISLLLFYAFNFHLIMMIGKMLLPRGDAIALGYGTVMRNLSIALTVAINAFGPAGSDAGPGNAILREKSAQINSIFKI